MPISLPCSPLELRNVLIRALQIGARIAVGITTLFCAGCIITPGSGPLGADVQRAKEGSEPAALPYALVKLTPDIVTPSTRPHSYKG